MDSLISTSLTGERLMTKMGLPGQLDCTEQATSSLTQWCRNQQMHRISCLVMPIYLYITVFPHTPETSTLGLSGDLEGRNEEIFVMF